LAAADVNLCASCAHARVVESARGSVFILCERSYDDARFARYPRLPVVRCIGYERPDRTPGACAAREEET
jgi:hypothetical protein